MQTIRSMMIVTSLTAGVGLLAMTGCGKSDSHDHGSGSSATTTAKQGDHGHAHDHDHDHSHGHGHSHGPNVPLGEQTISGLTIKPTLEGEIKAGQEASFDMKITGGQGKPAAVRLWIGSQDGRGALRARGEAEKDGWHAHVEVPNPIPADAKLWVEVEPASGEKVLAGFDLKK